MEACILCGFLLGPGQGGDQRSKKLVDLVRVLKHACIPSPYVYRYIMNAAENERKLEEARAAIARFGRGRREDDEADDGKFHAGASSSSSSSSSSPPPPTLVKCCIACINWINRVEQQSGLRDSMQAVDAIVILMNSEFEQQRPLVEGREDDANQEGEDSDDGEHDHGVLQTGGSSSKQLLAAATPTRKGKAGPADDCAAATPTRKGKAGPADDCPCKASPASSANHGSEGGKNGGQKVQDRKSKSSGAWTKKLIPIDNLLMFLNEPGSLQLGRTLPDRRSMYRILCGLVATCSVQQPSNQGEGQTSRVHIASNPYRMFLSPITERILRLFQEKYVRGGSSPGAAMDDDDDDDDDHDNDNEAVPSSSSSSSSSRQCIGSPVPVTKKRVRRDKAKMLEDERLHKQQQRQQMQWLPAKLTDEESSVLFDDLIRWWFESMGMPVYMQDREVASSVRRALNLEASVNLDE